MSDIPTVEDMLRGGSRSAKFPDTGDKCEGIVLGVASEQQTDFHTKAPKFWDDGKPAMHLVVTVDTKVSEGDDDDGSRRLYFKGRMLQALKSSLTKQAMSTLSAGDHVSVEYVGDLPSKTGLAPAKLYDVTVVAGAGPVVAAPAVGGDDEPF